ncbi:MAG: hypothetical protein Q9166_002107 [cf. Caloplaca sp. 2 TL-2023]
MDPASLSFAVVGMFLTCCKGYNIFSDAKKAPSDSQDAARQVRVEGSILSTWGEHWEIREEVPEQQEREKLKFYLMRDQTRSGVFDALCAISETFTDVKKLEKRYGVVFDYPRKGDRSPRVFREIQDLLDGRDHAPRPTPGVAVDADEATKKTIGYYKTRMSTLSRCRWTVRDKDRVGNLIKRLRRCNDDLHRLCEWEALAQINRALPTLALLKIKNFVDLHMMADIAEKAAEDKASPVAEGRKRLATMARFKAKVITPMIVSSKYQARWRRLDQRDYAVLSQSNPWSLGISRNQTVVFVEWQSYRGSDEQPNDLAEQQIHKLGDFLLVPNRPSEIRSLECLGLFEDRANDRYGVVYDLPAHLRNLPLPTRTEDRRIFNPSTLSDLIHNIDGIADLGVRFDLAKKLVQSVVVLHTCGWLHKNICPGNILFFAARPVNGEKVKDYKKDFGRPVLMGYGVSRPDYISRSEAYELPLMSRAPGHLGGSNVVGQAKKLPPLSRAPGYLGGSDVVGQAKKLTPLIYQHPDRATNSNRRFRHGYDLYSLGLVLLEIGLWQDLQKFDTSIFKDAYEFHHFVLKRLVPDLWGQCGAIYGEVVRECLTLGTDDAAMAEERQRKLAVRFSERLDKCAA